MSAEVSTIQDRVFAQLSKAMGPEKAAVLLREVLGEVGLVAIRTAQEQLTFANGLSGRGGFLAMVGSALKTQALLRGAREG